MALVLNATKEFCSDGMNPDTGGTCTVTRNSDQFSQESITDREPASYKCNFCPSSFSTLYHLQCHNVYKHSSILNNSSPETSSIYSAKPVDLKSSSAFQHHHENNHVKVSESGALDLSTVRSREIVEPKPDNSVSSSLQDEDDESDNDDVDKLVIDTQIDENDADNQKEIVSPKQYSSPTLLRSAEYFCTNDKDGAKTEQIPKTSQYYMSSPSQRYQIRPEKSPSEVARNYQNEPSNNSQPLDYRSRSPQRHISHQKEDLQKATDSNFYSPHYNSQADLKYPNMEQQSLLSMIPPLPNMGMMGNFPMPFGFNPFMMMPPNSFMPPVSLSSTQDARFPPQGDTFPSNMVSGLPYSPNMNLQPSKAGPVKRNSEKKSRSSKNSERKQKEVVEIYQCKSCNRQFSQVGNFHNHMKTHDSKVCACGICNMEFHDSYELQRHMRNTHTGNMPYKCEQCDREFSQYNNLRRHLRVHNGKNYKCHLCGRTFNEVFYLEMHMGSHTGERTYKCGVCSAIFSDNAELQKHVSTHSAEELHTCEVCGKSFSKACVLRQHKKMHSGLRPFKCEVCDKSFIHRHHLTIHSRMHSSNKPYVCKICKKEFAQTSHLYKHIRQHTEQPGVTEAMIHESLAPILQKLKETKDHEEYTGLPPASQNEEKVSNAVNNDMEGETISKNYRKKDEIENTMTVRDSSSNDVKDQEQFESLTSSDITATEIKDKVDLNDKSTSQLISEEKKADFDIEENTQINSQAGIIISDTIHRVHDSLKGIQHSGSQDELKIEEQVNKSDGGHDGCESDNASDKTGISVTSSLSEKRFINSPHSEIPLNGHCLEAPELPSIPHYEHQQFQNPEKQDFTSFEARKVVNSHQQLEKGRYSPISMSGESMNDEDFRPRSNSATENLEPNYKSTMPSAISPRIVSSDSILKEQQMLKDNCPAETTKPEIVMPLKKRRRYTSKPKKKSVNDDPSEDQQGNQIDKPSYPQMIQPIPPEAQQMYFLQLQQMQMALAANVMAAQGMMMQNASETMKNLHSENQRGVPNGFLHSANPNEIPFMRQQFDETMMKGLPYGVNQIKDHHGPLVSPRSIPYTNSSTISHSIPKTGYL